MRRILTIITFFIVVFVHYTRAASEYSLLFSDNFNSLNLTNLSGQNGWVSATANAWQVVTNSGGRQAKLADYTLRYDYAAITHTNNSVLNGRIKVDFTANPDASVPHAWLRRSSTTYQAIGYVFLFYEGSIYFDYVPGDVANTVQLASTAAPSLTYGSQYTLEFEVANNTEGNPVLSVWIYAAGGTNTNTANLTYTDTRTAKILNSGYAGLGGLNTSGFYDNFNLYSVSNVSGQQVQITFPLREVSGAASVATIALSNECNTVYRIPYIQTTNVLTATATATAPTNGGLKFVLTGKNSNQTTLWDFSSPYSVTFSNIVKGEYGLDVYVVDSGSNVQSGTIYHDVATNIGVGDIYVAIGDSTTEGYDGTAWNVSPYADWLNVPAVSTDHRNYPQCGIASNYYQPHWQELSHHIAINNALGIFNDYPVFILNEGVAGITTSGYNTRTGYSSWQTRMNSIKPNKWLVHLGINDGGGSASYQNTMQTLLNTLKNTYGAIGTNITLAVPAVYSNWQPYTSNLVSSNVLNVGPDFNAFYASHSSLITNTVHPNIEGHVQMGRLWILSLIHPKNVSAENGDNSVTVSWSSLADVDSSVIGYKVYHGTVSTQLTNIYDAGASTAYVLGTNLASGQTNYFSIRGYDNGAVETRLSPAVSLVYTNTPVLPASRKKYGLAVGTNGWMSDAILKVTNLVTFTNGVYVRDSVTTNVYRIWMSNGVMVTSRVN